MSKVKCNFCKKEFNEITTGHLRKCCGLDLNEYVKMFPDSKISSERTKNVNCYFCGEIIVTSIFSSLNVYICEKCKNKGITSFEEVEKKCCYCDNVGTIKKYAGGFVCEDCKNIGKNLPNITKERNEKIFETYLNRTGYINPMFNPEVIESKDEKYFNKTGYKNPSQNPKVKIKKEETGIKNNGVAYTLQDPEKLQLAVNGSREFWSDPERSEEARLKMSKSAIKRMIEHRGSVMGSFYSSKNNCKVYYRSYYELEFYTILENRPDVEEYKVEPFSIKYFDESTNKERNYLPDVLITYVNGEKELSEFKLTNEMSYLINQCKFSAAEKFCAENNYKWRIFTENDL